MRSINVMAVAAVLLASGPLARAEFGPGEPRFQATY